MSPQCLPLVIPVPSSCHASSSPTVIPARDTGMTNGCKREYI
ncbi:hypothetical protein [Wolbachia endosymbiont of Liriomyza huidobrensis]